MLKRVKIKPRLLSVMLFLLLLFTVSVLFAIYSMDRLSTVTNSIFQHPFKVATATVEIIQQIQDMHLLCQETILKGESSSFKTQVVKNREIAQHVQRNLALIRERYLGDPADVDQAELAYLDYSRVVDSVWGLIQENKLQEARSTLLPHLGLAQTKLEHSLRRIAGFAAERATRFGQEADVITHNGVRWLLAVSALLFVLGLLFFYRIARSIIGPISVLRNAMRQMTKGNYALQLPLMGDDEIGELACATAFFSQELLRTGEERKHADWLKAGRLTIDDKLRGDPDKNELCRRVLSEICRSVDAAVGAVYSVGFDRHLELEAGFAYSGSAEYPAQFAPGEGLVGQAALEKAPIVLSELPPKFLRISSALGSTAPVTILAYPVCFDGQLKLVIELGFLAPLKDDVIEWLRGIEPALAIGVQSADERSAKAQLLDTTQRQAQELDLQQQELRVALEQSQKVEERLRLSQSELMAGNEELRLATTEIKQQNDLLERRHEELKREQILTEQKARELDLANQYKARFLANMSHELRTPLNSIMLLSQNMAKNKPGNLIASQVKAMEIVHASGADLLALINEILDFSKIESRTIALNAEKMELDGIVFYIREHFTHLLENKGLSFSLTVDERVPATIVSDPLRVRQILKNLLSNAIKYTDYGAVDVTISSGLNSEFVEVQGEAAEVILIAVKDSGCGIKREDQNAVFEAFTQVGERRLQSSEGTGLGLAIARELAILLGGNIHLVSEPGVGSTFTLYLPLDSLSAIKSHTGSIAKHLAPNRDKPSGSLQTVQSQHLVNDDRSDITPGDRVILVVEDDINFGQVLVNLCHERGFKTLRATNAEDGLALLKKYVPTGMLLDIVLPGMDGISLLDLVKDDLDIRHVPVHVMSVESAAQTVLRKGAVGFLQKPVTEEQIFGAIERMAAIIKKQVKQVLVIEDDEVCLHTLITMLSENNLVVHGAKNASEAIDLLDRMSFDCIVLDLGLPDVEGYDLLHLLDQKHHPLPPVIINTGREISEEDEYRLHKYADTIILKSVKSNERLLDEVTLFLHKVTSELPPPSIEILQRVRDKDSRLRGKCVLLVDDDIRNLYALSSALEQKGMEILCAQSVHKADAILNQRVDIAAILTDIMMPVEDGYSWIKRLREQARFTRLPIIALTAKAMKDDRERCLKVGANDYLTKPIELDSLMTLLSRWVGA